MFLRVILHEKTTGEVRLGVSARVGGLKSENPEFGDTFDLVRDIAERVLIVHRATFAFRDRIDA